MILINALDQQVNKVVWVILQAFGKIPTRDTNIELLIAYLQSHPRFGSFLADAMGLGKTFT